MFTSSHWGTYRVDRTADRLTLQPFDKDPRPSPIGQSLADAVTSNLRIEQPMARASWLDGNRQLPRRGRDAFVPLSWESAFELAADALNRVRSEYGNQAIFGGSYGWASAGRFHHAQSQLHRFLNLTGGYTSSVNTYSSGAAEVLVPHVLGYDYRTCNDATTTWNVLAEHSQLIVAFGGLAGKNAQVHPGGISRHLAQDWMTQCAQRGVQFVNVSPMRDDLDASLNQQWLAIRPNTDTALMLGLAHTLIDEQRYDDKFVHTHCVGFAEVKDYLLGNKDGIAKNAEWAAKLTDIPSQTIRTLARQMAAQRTFITLSLSIQRGDHGEQPYWAGITLAALLGQVGLPGGGVGFSYAALGGIGNPRSGVKGPTLSQGDNPISSFIPVARLTDMLLHPGDSFAYNGQTYHYPDIKLVYWAGGNPFHHQQDLTRLERAWQQPDTVIVHEIWWNPMARYADLVLPATTTLERNDIGSNSADAYIIAMKQAVAPVGQARSDFEILRGIAAQLGMEDQFTEQKDEMQWLRHIYQDYAHRSPADLPNFDEFWRASYAEVPAEANHTVFLSEFRQSAVDHPLPTPSGKIELYSQTIAAFEYDDCPGQASWIAPTEWLGSQHTARYPLHLLSNQPAPRLHSQLDHGQLSQQAKVAGREAVYLNPQDARARGITNGDVVRIYNDRGACLAGAQLRDTLRQGVVLMATGAWFDPLYSAQDNIELDRSGNANMLTLDKGTSRLAQASSAQSALVEIEKCSSTPPPVEAYQPPDMRPASSP